MSEVDLAATWLYATLSGDTALKALLSTDPDSALRPAIYQEEAPQRAMYPLVVISYEGGDDVTVVDSTIILHAGEFLVRVIGQTEANEDLAAVADRIHILLHKKSGTATGGAIDACRRLSPFRLSEVVEGVHYRHAGGIYQVFSREVT